MRAPRNPRQVLSRLVGFVLLVAALAAPARATPGVEVAGRAFPGRVVAEGSTVLVELEPLAEVLGLRLHPIYGGVCVTDEPEEVCVASGVSGRGRVLVRGTPVEARREGQDWLVDLGATASALGLSLDQAGGTWRLAGAGPALAPGRRILRPNAGSPGAEVDLPAVLVPGRWNVAYYYLDWCPACWRLGPDLEALARGREDLALVEIDILDWNSPVARAEKVKASPTVRVYDGEGRLVASDRAAEEWLRQQFGFRFPTGLKCLGAPGHEHHGH